MWHFTTQPLPTIVTTDPSLLRKLSSRYQGPAARRPSLLRLLADWSHRPAPPQGIATRQHGSSPRLRPVNERVARACGQEECCSGLKAPWLAGDVSMPCRGCCRHTSVMSAPWVCALMRAATGITWALGLWETWLAVTSVHQPSRERGR